MNDKGSKRRLAGRIAMATLIVVLVVVAGSWSYDSIASLRAERRYPPSGEFVTVDGVQMHYVCEGSQEPTLVLVHGFAGGLSDWQPLMEALQPGQRACAFDRLGADYSGSPADSDRNMEAVVEDLHSALTQLGIEQPVLVGHSLGGGIVQLYAARYPASGVVLIEGLSADIADDVVRRLGSYAVLSVPARMGLLRPLAPSFVSRAYGSDLRKQQIALRSRARSILAMAREGTQASEGLGTQTLRHAEDSLSIPLLIIAAGDTDVPEGKRFTDSLTALAERHPQTTMHVIPDAHHYVMATHPVQTAQIIEDWVQQQVILSSHR